MNGKPVPGDIEDEASSNAVLLKTLCLDLDIVGSPAPKMEVRWDIDKTKKQ